MTSYEHMVARQIKTCELTRQLEKEGLRASPVHVDGIDYRPTLLISRQCGSGGTTLAHLVGERLKWQVFDREIVEEVARSAHVRQRLIQSVDEQVLSGWRALRHRLADGEGVGRESYLFHLRQVIVSLGHHGSVIILGRGANYILPPESALRVRLVAPLELRARRVAEREHISLPRARHQVEQTDAERTKFIREAFGRDVNAPEDYDMVLDLGESSMLEAAENILTSLAVKLQVQLETAPCAK